MTCFMQAWVGAYVLDALEPTETEDLRRHLVDCSTCAGEVVNLAWIPALLDTVRLDDIEGLDDVPVRKGDPPSPRRRRRLARVLFGVGVAAAIAAAAVGSAALVPTPDASPVAIQTVDARSQVHAAVTLDKRAWGTELHLTLSSVQPGQTCSLVARSRDGRAEVAATWVATYRGTADVPGTTSIPVDKLREVDVVAAGGQRLARLVVPPHP
jgi:hypothetical protein